MLKYRIIPVTPFQQNCSLVWCDQTRQAALIDPGGDTDQLIAAVRQEGVQLSALWLTHGHLDHVGGTKVLAEQFSLPIIGPHSGDDFWLKGLQQQAAMFGFPEPGQFAPSQWLHDGDQLTLGNLTLDVLHCPGHTPGHVVLVEHTAKMAFVGDVIFAGSVGRTDFPQGNAEQLVSSIRTKLFTLADDYQFVPGHGPMSTIGQERATNPFVADSRFG